MTRIICSECNHGWDWPYEGKQIVSCPKCGYKSEIPIGKVGKDPEFPGSYKRYYKRKETKAVQGITENKETIELIEKKARYITHHTEKLKRRLEKKKITKEKYVQELKKIKSDPFAY